MDFNGFQWQVWFDIGCEGIEVARLHVGTCALWHCSKNVKHTFHLISWYFMIFLHTWFFDHFKFMSQLLRPSVLQLAFFQWLPRAGQKRTQNIATTGWSETLRDDATVTNRVRVVVPWRQRGASTEDWDDEEGYYAAQVERSLKNFRNFPILLTSPNTLSWWQNDITIQYRNCITSKWAKAISSCLGHLQWINLSLNHPNCCISHSNIPTLHAGQVHLLVNTCHNLHAT